MKHLLILLSAAIGLLSFTALPVMAKDVKAPTVAERQTSATKALAKADTAAIYAKGLCCPSCAIGVRKYLSKLPFVDRKQAKSGVELDAKAQLAIIRLKPGAIVDNAAVSKAIRKAGYDPVEIYQNRDGNVVRDYLK